MAKDTGIVSIHGKQYKTVALRVSEFREKYPIDDGWGIETQCYAVDAQTVIMRAVITDPEGRLVATGYAEEERSQRGINSTSALENCETSAIGRALSAAGFGGDAYASAEEVAQAISKQGSSPSAAPGQPSQKQKNFAWSLIKKQPEDKQEAYIKRAKTADAAALSKLIDELNG
jgi:deoxycytidylate deaminase